MAWSEYRLSDVIRLIGGGTPKTTNPDYWNGNIPWLSVADFNNGYRRVYTSEKTITEKALKESSTTLLKAGQLIISARGTVGVVAQLGRDMAFNQSCYGINGKPEITTNDFLYYFLKYAVNNLKQITHGAVFDTITRETFNHIAIKLPRLSEQKVIASILGALDDKIELNRKMNETLEAMARATYKAWFVDFDPVPVFGPHKEWQDSPLGKIPKGWKVGTLSELCKIVMGQSPPGETYNEVGEGLPFYQGIRDFGFRFPTKRVYCTAPTRIAQTGDVLLSVRAPVGSLNIASEKCAIGRGVAAIRIMGQHCGFLYYLMKETQSGWEKFEAEGTVFGSAGKTDVQNFVAICPEEEIIRRFNKLIQPIDQLIKNNTVEAFNLTVIRDALLPKLLSGETRVQNLEKAIGGGS